MTIYEKLNKVQAELVAPKNQYNSFGKYKYRSCEDIIEGVKPLLEKYGLVLVIGDDIVKIEERYYVKATVKVVDTESKDEIETHAFAREEEVKKGMDSSQVTGATSSYARKYALNGLFAIDDTKDADTDEHKKQTDKPQTQPQQPNKPTQQKPHQTEIQKLISEIDSLAKTKSIDDEAKAKVVELIKKVNNGKTNYKLITDVKVAKELKTQLESL